MHKLRLNLAHAYMVLFLLYMIAPLVVMSGAAFNDSKLPSIVPWKGFTTHWFGEMIADHDVHDGDDVDAAFGVDGGEHAVVVIGEAGESVAMCEAHVRSISSGRLRP